MNDFKAEPEALKQEELVACEQVMRSGWYVLGREVEQFESRWAQCCGVDFGIGVGNGMDAIEIGLRALNVGPGDEVITTPMTAFATVLAIFRAGAIPVLADIDATTALLDFESVQRCLSPQTKGILLVHLYGQMRSLGKWQALANAENIYLFEDCAQAHLASWQGQRAGSLGAWGAYSFYPTKNLGAVGDAGIIVTNQAAIAHQAKVLRNYGQSERYHHDEIGLNSRLDELQAALLTVRLAWLEKFTHRRCEIAQRYFADIQNPNIELLAPPIAPENHVYHLFVLKCAERDRLMQHLKSREIASLCHYPVPIHRQPPCHDIHRDPQGLVVSERYAQQCLSIPCHPQMSDRDVECVIEAVNDF
ncbi:MAG: DegT/DnrJ/EryC1/StrS family aminotransferase [Leptolyngbyaceae cyanobacterium]